MNKTHLLPCLLSLLPLLAAGQISVGFDQTAPTCNGYNNGQITAQPTGGQPPYNYFWSNGQSNQTAFGLQAGIYGVTVTDANGLSAAATTNLPAPALLEVEILPAANTCAGNIGTFEASVSGGSPPYLFNWSFGPTTQTITDPPVGYHFVSVTDANGCQAVTGRAFNASLIVTVLTIDVMCAATCDGSAVAVVSDGTGPFSFLWNTGATSQTIWPLPPGDYTVTVTDGLGCTASATGTVGGPSAFFIQINVQNPCSGNASAFATANGGTPPHVYEWAHGVSGQQAGNLSPGTYFVVVTDANGCQVDTSVTVGTGVAALISNVQNASCNGANNGSATATTNSGASPFSFLWSDGQATATATGLAVGIYEVTVTDAAGCTGTATASIGSGSDILLQANAVSATCGGSDGGSATAVVGSGGTPGFSFLWSDGQTTATATNLPAGIYSVTVTDAAGCTATAQVAVLAPPNDLEIELAAMAAGCGGSALGSATATVASGGTPGFIFLWNNGQNTATATGLTAGFYEVTVSDALGCTATGQVTVGQSDGLTILVQAGNASCHNTPDGNANVALVSSNALPPLSFFWSNGQATQAIQNILPGNYAVTVTDAQGCSGNVPVAVNANASVTANFTFDIDGCPVDTAEVQFMEAVVFSPASNPIVSWDWQFGDGQTANLPDPLLSFTDSTVTATLIAENATGCRDTFSQVIDLQDFVGEVSPAAFTLTSTGCSDADTLTFQDATVAPGDVTSWLWTFSNGVESTAESVQLIIDSTQLLVATLTIEFETGCTATLTDSVLVRVFQPGFLGDTVVACLPDPAAELNPVGNADLTYLWSPSAGLDPGPAFFNPVASVDETTVFAVLISQTDSIGVCEAQREVTVLVPPAIGLQVPDDVAVCEAGTATLTAVAGISNLEFQWSDRPDFGEILAETPALEVAVAAPPVTYYVRVTDVFGCAEMGAVNVGYYPVLAQVPDFQDVCLGEKPIVTPTGISPGDQISWQPGEPAEAELADTAVFVLTVTNAQGCSKNDTLAVNVVDLNGLFEVVPQRDTVLAGEGVALSVLASFDHTCTWSPSESLDDALACDPTATPLRTTTYTVEVQNALGCRGSGAVEITVTGNECAEPMIFVPNAFTPDDDGLNDVLYVRGYNIERVLEFAIYDRWGKKVFESRSLDEGWDGSFEGRKMTGDSFAYYLSLVCKTGEEFFKKGNVTVLR